MTISELIVKYDIIEENGMFLHHGDLNLCCKNIMELPNNLHIINGSLDLRDNPIGWLPTGLVVDRHLFLYATNVFFFPDDIVVKQDVGIHGAKFQVIPNNGNIGGDIIS